VWLLELNCDPDLKVFDTRFAHVAREITRDTVDAAVCPAMGLAARAKTGATDVGGFHLVFEEDVPDRFLQP
jgi:hypothetical protein